MTRLRRPPAERAEKLARLGEVVAKAIEGTVPVAHVRRKGETVARVAQRRWGT